MKILVIAEHNHQQLSAATLPTVSAATALGPDTHILIAGKDCSAVAAQAAQIEKITAVLQVDAEHYAHFLAENFALLIATLAKDYTHIFAPATTFGKNILPRAAALLDAAMLSDITAVVDATTFIRPVYAGNALATVQSNEPIKIISVRPAAFTAAPAGHAPAPVHKLPPAPAFARTTFINYQATQSARPELTSARIVVAGGRGLQNAENFLLIEKLADCLHAAIGASRAAVDAGFISNDFQVGQTGKIIAPDIYIAIGISGAIQHAAGMKDSKIIVAINKDPDAPIFQIADYGLVADLFTAIPELIEKLSSRV